MEYVQISTRSCCLLLCCKGWHRRSALLPLSPVSLLPCVRCRGKVSEGSPAKDLPKSSGGPSLGEAGCGFVQISSRLHCHGKARRALLWPKMSLSFPEPRPENCPWHQGCVLSVLARQGPAPRVVPILLLPQVL